MRPELAICWGRTWLGVSWLVFRLLLVSLFINPLMPGSAMASPDTSGNIVVESARIRTEAHSWLLDAHAAIELTPAMQAGLDSGVPLTFIVEFELREPRAFWTDVPLLGFKRRYRLIYYDLTRHYRVQALNRGASRNYRSLMSALDGLGSLTALPIGRPTIMALQAKQSIQTGPALQARLSIRFDSKALPLPLQPFFGSPWQLEDADYEWSVH